MLRGRNPNTQHATSRRDRARWLVEQSDDIKRDVALARLATQQHGLVSRAQLRQLGASSGWIDRRVANGSLAEAAPGVLAVVGSPSNWDRAALAAVMSTGAGAAASHWTAAHLHGFAGRPDRLDVSLVTRNPPSRPWDVHTRVRPFVVVRRRSIPTVDAVQTLIDLAAAAPNRVGRLIDEAGRRRATTLEQLLQRVEAGGQGVAGFARFSHEVSRRVEWLGRTDSEMEDQFALILADGGVRQPEPQMPIYNAAGRLIKRADFGYRPSRTIVELDGYQFHSDPTAFAADRAIQNELNELGYTTYRYACVHLDESPDVVLRQMRFASRMA